MSPGSDPLDGARAELAASDPVMAELIERLGDRSVAQRRRGIPKPDAFGALMRTVVAQQVSTAAARTIYGRALDVFDGRAPSPEEVLAVGEEPLRAAGLSGRKVTYIRDLATHVIDGRLEIDRLEDLSDEEVIAEIVAVRGFGQWSAEMFLIFHLERPDVISGGDLAIRKAIQLVHGTDEMPTPQEVAEIGQRWAPHRSLASIYLWESLAKSPMDAD